MRFTKVHGAGNDFVLIDATKEPPRDFNALGPKLCHRHTGVGADGLLIVLPSETCDIRARIVNADGSEAEMCGNGIRAFAKYVYDRGIVRKKEFSIETIAGEIVPDMLLDETGAASAVRVNIGKPLFDCADIPVQGEGTCLGRTLQAEGCTFAFSAVRLGVPHVAVEVEDPKTFDLRRYGPAIETHPLFPAKTNVNFYKVLDRNNIEVRTWERGVGVTLACGTGSSSTVLLASLLGKTERTARVHLELATLTIEWEADDSVFMTGPAAIAFDGEIDV